MKYAGVVAVILVSFVIGFSGCSQQKGGETPKQEYVTKALTPAKAEVKGANFVAELSELQVSMTVDTASKEIASTPSLNGRYKVTNVSKDFLEVHGVTFEYLDQGGKPIAFKSGEKISKASLSLSSLKPGEFVEGSLDVTIPRAAIKELGKIDINLVHVTSPLKRETLTLPEKIE
jgi:hypothetical protein